MARGEAGSWRFERVSRLEVHEGEGREIKEDVRHANLCIVRPCPPFTQFIPTTENLDTVLFFHLRG